MTTKNMGVFGGLVACLLLVVGCSEEGKITSETTRAVQISAPEVSGSESETSTSTASVPSGAPTSASGSPTTPTTSQSARFDPTGLEEVEMGADYFTGQGSGYRGTHFQLKDGSVKCNIKGTSISIVAICTSDTASFVGVPVSPMSSDKINVNSVGWSKKENRTYADFTEEPAAALYQGDLFNTPSASLESGKKVTIPVNLSTETIVCGNPDNSITCIVQGTSHGFTISKTSVKTW